MCSSVRHGHGKENGMTSLNAHGAQEKYAMALRSLYRQWGYRLYKMSRFEEYDLYARNKDFLPSENVLTFTDTNGRLMALKPDVTLSIIRNAGMNGHDTARYYYHESVYRLSPRSGTFREMTQVGLECLGDVDAYCLLEVLTLAAESLKTISPDCVLSISHIGFLSRVLSGAIEHEEARDEALRLLSQKNRAGLKALCAGEGIAGAAEERLLELVSLSDAPERAFARLEEIARESGAEAELAAMRETVMSLEEELRAKVRIDFSVHGNMKYYNGLVFRGYVEGVPDSVLSGGQYDPLMRRMNREGRAVGFAVYLNTLEHFGAKEEADADALLLYREGDAAREVLRRAQEMRKNGKIVLAARKAPVSFDAGETVRFPREKEAGTEC